MSDPGDSERPVIKHRLSSRLFFSVGLIALGVLLFLGNLGLVPIHDVWVLWPVLPIILGIGYFGNQPERGSRIQGGAMVLFGLVFLSSNFGWIHIHTDDNSWIFSLLLIGIGFSVLQSRWTTMIRPGWPRALPRKAPQNGRNWLNDFTLLGALKRKVETSDFAGGDLTSIFGSIEIDLRRAFISSAENSAVLNVAAVFASAKIRVPQEWRVHVNAASILGSFEDKTVPPNTGPDAPTLIITGLAVLGSVEIED